MSPLVTLIMNILSVLTVIANISTAILLFTFLFAKFKKNKISGLPKKILDLASRWALPLCFLVALVSTTGSLFFSEVAKFEPCILCWYQRIMMYPLILLFGSALLRKESKQIIYYAFPLVLVGMAIAGFHYVEQLTPDSFLPCKTIGFSVSCTKFFFKTFGYITIPTMSLSAFGFIFTLLLAKRMNTK